MTNKVLIVGAGAIGGFYGGLLAKTGAEVSVVCRSDYEHVKQNGFRINSHTLGGWTFIPSQVLRDAADFKGTADYVLLCTKIIPSVDRASIMRPAVSADTAVVFIQNGVEIEQEMLESFPDNEVISGPAFQSGIKSGLVNEHQLRRMQQRLRLLPGVALQAHILARYQCFFKGQSETLEAVPERGEMNLHPQRRP
ncbi:MAG: 2-dehydropantoate 2-reductase [Methylococcales bacterium]|nr:2-dehydropantoate 2-reductase [Methylococcales bacterium]